MRRDSMAIGRPPGNSPRTDDALAPPRSRGRVLDAGSAAAILNNFLEAAYAVGVDAEERFRAARLGLRRHPEEALLAIAKVQAGCRRRDYPLRWALVYAATQLNHSAALPLLRDLVLTPIPPEESADPHSFSTVGEETVLRTTAVEGVGRLAAGGNRKALDALFKFLAVPSLSIRRASVQAILRKDRRLGKRISEHLPVDQRYLLKVVPQKVTAVPQVPNPKRHLRRTEGRLLRKPAPPAFADDGSPSRTRTRRPRIGG
jgi:hypothetical protein